MESSVEIDKAGKGGSVKISVCVCACLGLVLVAVCLLFFPLAGFVLLSGVWTVSICVDAAFRAGLVQAVGIVASIKRAATSD